MPRITNLVTRRLFEDRFAEWREAFRAEAIEPQLTRLNDASVAEVGVNHGQDPDFPPVAT